MPSPAPSSSSPVLLVPGAFTGAWMWAGVIDRLTAAGVQATVVELPTIGEGSGDEDFSSDVEALRAALGDLVAPAVVCAHSYGGAVLTAAAAGPHPSVRELVYLAGAAPASGDSMASTTAEAGAAAGAAPDGPGPAPRADGLMEFPAAVARQALFNDCDDELARAALDQLEPQSFAGLDTVIPVAAWTQLPSVYVRATDDLVPRALGHGFLEQCVAVIDVPTGHCPHWSRPELIADLLAGRAATA